MSKICFVAQFPPPIHGLSKAVDTLYNSELNEEFEFEKVDITNNKNFLKNVSTIRRSDADLFYFTISQTKGGNLRDLLYLKAIGKRKCLIHLHGGYYRTMVDGMSGWQKKANFKAIGKLSGAIVLGPSLKWIFKDMISEDRVYTVANCVDDTYLLSDEEFERKVSSIDTRTVKHVLYLSNFFRTKGYPEVLEMAKIEKEKVESGSERRFHFDFAGAFFDAEEEEFFRSFVKENDLEDYVTYHGVVSGEKKRDILNSADVFCLLTTYPREGQPISILEALGNGMVVVTTNHAGIGDIVDHDNAIIIDKDNSNKAAEAYKALEEADFAVMERNGRYSVKSNFMQKNYIDSMKNTFEQVIGLDTGATNE